MPELVAYAAPEALPPKLEHEIRALLDAQWPEPNENLRARPLIDPNLHPMYFVLCDGDKLVSYARTIWAWSMREGQAIKVYGLGDVITHPRLRRKGYARRVVEAATSHIRSDAAADVAVLLTEPALENLYGASGWAHVAGMRVVTSEADGTPSAGDFVMMLFLSAAAREGRDMYWHQPLVLAGDEW